MDAKPSGQKTNIDRAGAENDHLDGTVLFEGGNCAMKDQYSDLTTHTVLEGVNNCSIITINNDAKRNAMSIDLIRSLRQSLAAALSEAPRAVVIAASGSVFSAGHDFRELSQPDPKEMEILFNQCAELIRDIRGAACPVVSRVQGAAIGAGCLLALECDFVVAAQEATFQTPGGARGWFCFTPMLALMGRTTPKRALEMLIGGEKITAAEAFDWGLINRVTTLPELDSEVKAFVEKITRGSAEMIALGKRSFYELSELPFDRRLELATELMRSTVVHPDAQKRISAFNKPKQA